MVHHLTQRTARQVGWHDRGVLAPGHLGDVNVIDVDAPRRPPPAHRAGPPCRRPPPDAVGAGYVHTIKRGMVTFSDGEHTGDLPGALVRGPQSAGYSSACADVSAAPTSPAGRSRRPV